MKEFLLELDEHKLKIYIKNKNQLIPYKIRGEEIFFIDSFDDAFEIKEVMKRDYEGNSPKFNIVYSKNVSKSFLNLIYLTFLLNKEIDKSYLEENVVFESFNKDSITDIYDVMEAYFGVEILPKEKPVNLELEEKIKTLEKEKIKMKSEARELRIQIEKEKLKIEKEKILLKLNSY